MNRVDGRTGLFSGVAAAAALQAAQQDQAALEQENAELKTAFRRTPS